WLEKRASELRTRYEKVWIADFPGATIGERAFSRGFLNRVELHAKPCVKTSPPSWYREPFLSVVLKGWATQVEALCASGWLEGVTHLDLRPEERSEADAIAEAVVGSGCANDLRNLAFREKGYTDQTLLAIAKGRLPQLRGLSCRGRFTS